MGAYTEARLYFGEYAIVILDKDDYMNREELKQKFQEELTEQINSFDYYNFDGWAEENELSGDDIDYCLELVRSVKIVFEE